MRTIWQESPLGFVSLATAAAARGFVPAIATVLVGTAVAAVPSAIEAGGLAGGGRPLAVALIAIAAVYGIDQIAESLLFPVEEGWAMRVYGKVEQRAMRAMVGPPLMDHLLDAGVQRTTDLALRQEWPHIGAFSTALLRAITWGVAALTQAALVARYSWLLAAVTVSAWAAVGGWVRRQELVGMLTAWDRIRRPHYYRELAMEHRAAGEIRAFTLGPWLIGRFDDGWYEGMQSAWRLRVATGKRIGPLLAVLVAGTTAGVAVIAAGASSGDLSPDRLAVVVSAYVGLTQLALPQEWTEPLLWGATRLPALFELEDRADLERARARPAEPVPAEGLPRHGVRFDGVTFRYPGRTQPVLRDLDLSIEAGRSLAIVGVNGAGKTTLVKLLARLHDPDEGRILVDGTDLRSIDPDGWHRRVAATFQEYLRLPLPAGDNVALATPVAPRLDEAAASAGADDVVKGLPHGWGTVLSRRYHQGADLSGGEWQRVALARVVYAVRSGAGVLVLDEPTANLDARAEAELFDRFLDVTRGATTVLISHRFSTVRRADNIVVIDEGRVVESGSHDELVAANGLYAELFELQASRYQTIPRRSPRVSG